MPSPFALSLHLILRLIVVIASFKLLASVNWSAVLWELARMSCGIALCATLAVWWHRSTAQQSASPPSPRPAVRPKSVASPATSPPAPPRIAKPAIRTGGRRGLPKRISFAEGPPTVHIVSRWFDPRVHRHAAFRQWQPTEDIPMAGTEEEEMLDREVDEYLEVLGSMIEEGMVTNFNGVHLDPRGLPIDIQPAASGKV